MHIDINFPHLFEHTFNSAPIGMALVSPTGEWIRVNKALCALTGYSSEELLSLTFQDITYPEDLHLDMQHVRDTLDGKIDSYQMEKRYIRKTKDLVATRLSVTLVRGDDGEPAFFISQIEDIQKQKDLEAGLTQEAAHFNSIINTITDPVFVKTAEHAITFANDALCDFMAMSREALTGKKSDALVPTAQANYADRGDDEVLQTGKDVFYEEVLTNKNGVERSVIVKKRLYKTEGGEKFIVGTFHDVTEQKAREAELKKKYLELEEMNRMMLGRELKMIELKKQLAELRA